VKWTTDRESAKRGFLAKAELSWARREPLAGDASTRSYERLHLPGGRTLMLMDSPPSAESRPCGPRATPEQREKAGYNAMARLSAGRVDAFAACAGYLRSRGLSAPEVIALDAPMGLAVLEDLGDDLFTEVVRKGGSEQELYRAAIDTLIQLHGERPPVLLESEQAKWPLLVYDRLALKTGVDLFIEWAPKLIAMHGLDAAARAECVVPLLLTATGPDGEQRPRAQILTIAGLLQRAVGLIERMKKAGGEQWKPIPSLPHRPFDQPPPGFGRGSKITPRAVPPAFRAARLFPDAGQPSSCPCRPWEARK